jgi:hypothetical protein
MDDMIGTKSPLKTAYDRFMESEGIPIVEGWYVADVRETERRPWKRLGGKGAYTLEATSPNGRRGNTIKHTRTAAGRFFISSAGAATR